MFGIFQNSQPVAVAQFFSFFGILFLAAIFMLLASIKAMKLYFNGSSDGRVPSVFAYAVVYFLSMLWIFLQTCGGHKVDEGLIFVKMMCFFFAAQCLRGRILGYPSIRLTRTIKLIFSVAYDIIIFTCITIFIHSYRLIHPTFSTLTSDTFASFLRGFLSLRDAGDSLVRLTSVLLSMFSLVCCGLILLFDHLEQRRNVFKFTIVCLVVPNVGLALLGNVIFIPFETSIFWSMLLVFLLIGNMVVYYSREIDSIIKRAIHLDPNYTLVMTTIKTLSASKNREAKIVSIVEMLRNNESTRKLVLSSKFNDRHHVLEELKARLENGA